MSCKVAVVIPCYRVKAHILGVIARLGPEVTQVYVVDDACPEESTGTVMLAALPALVGLQLLLSFISFDVTNIPRRAIHPDLPDSPASETAMPATPKY